MPHPTAFGIICLFLGTSREAGLPSPGPHTGFCGVGVQPAPFTNRLAGKGCQRRRTSLHPRTSVKNFTAPTIGRCMVSNSAFIHAVFFLGLQMLPLLLWPEPKPPPPGVALLRAAAGKVSWPAVVESCAAVHHASRPAAPVAGVAAKIMRNTRALA